MVNIIRLKVKLGRFLAWTEENHMEGLYDMMI